MAKTTDLTSTFLKSPWKINVETVLNFEIGFKQNNIFYIFLATLPSTQNIKIIYLIFFCDELALKIWEMKMHFNLLLIL